MNKGAKFVLSTIVIFIVWFLSMFWFMPTWSFAQESLNASIKLGDHITDAKILSRNLSAQLTNDSTEFSVKAWGDDCEFKVMGLTPKQTKFYKRTDGGLEWEIILNNKPDSQILTYPIETKGLKFNKQELHLLLPHCPMDEIEDSVINSYAVYHATKRNNVTKADGTQEHYMAGKAFHIYRPKAWDSNDDTVWCDMDIKAGTISIILPADFREYAVYPVVIDPNIGVSTLGGTNFTPTDFRHQIMWDDSYTTTNGGDMDDAFVGHLMNGNPHTAHVYAWEKGADCANSTIHFTSDAISLTSATSAWASVSAGGSFAAATEYMISCAGEGSGAGVYRWRFDANGDSRYLDDADFTAPADLTGCTLDGTDVDISMYISYTESGAAAPLKARRRRLIQESSFNYPDTVDSALLAEFGFEFRDGAAIGAYNVYDRWDNPQDAALIYIEMPPRRLDINRNGSANILDLTYWIQEMYYGGF